MMSVFSKVILRTLTSTLFPIGRLQGLAQSNHGNENFVAEQSSNATDPKIKGHNSNPKDIHKLDKQNSNVVELTQSWQPWTLVVTIL